MYYILGNKNKINEQDFLYSYSQTPTNETELHILIQESLHKNTTQVYHVFLYILS